MGKLDTLSIGENENITPETLKELLKTKYIKSKAIYPLLDQKAVEVANEILEEIASSWETREHSTYYYGKRELSPILSMDGDEFFGKKLSTRFRYAYARIWDLTALYRSSTHTVTISLVPMVFFAKKYFKYFYKKLKNLLKIEKVELSYVADFLNATENKYTLHYVFLTEKK